MSTAWNFAVLLFEFCYLLNFAHSKNMTKFCLEQTSRIKESETTLTSVNALSAIHCAGLCSLDELCLSGSFDSNWNHCVLDSSYNKQTEVSTQAVYFAKIKPPEDPVFLTSTSGYSYNLRLLGVPLTGFLPFEVKACSNVILAFYDKDGMLLSNVRIGEDNGLKSGMYLKTVSPSPNLEVIHDSSITDCNSFELFWVSWNTTTVQAGKGFTNNIDTFLALTTNDAFIISDVSVFTSPYVGEWIFGQKNADGNCP